MIIWLDREVAIFNFIITFPIVKEFIIIWIW